MTKRSALDGTVYEGVPPVLAVPTGLQTPEGAIAALVLVVQPDVTDEVVEEGVEERRSENRR